VVQTGILPQINTGIASKRAGVGQIGAGLVTPPVECFAAAVIAFAEAVTSAPPDAGVLASHPLSS